ncbi:hypothetical protein TL16_g04763 [Triparma laevis f. inornata]|uniref:N-acetyltransferase domain-containing protein n=2 Tax=Triparma laevis TaxID=1534972 RepID=A0A9W7KW95_9STRA|nr:hypothetical protein TL16_g04763 [Triparma laevis f. inornata]GMI13551.1 hypothetical protein TrLO_g6798 [Triparma laevis f. longispina]
MSSHLDRVSNDLLRQWQDSDDAESSLLDVQKTRAQSLLNSTVLPPTLPSKTPPSNMTLQYSLRPPTSPELGYLYTWLKQDEETYPGLKSKNPARYWSRAGETGALQNCFETECGVLCKRKGHHVCRLLLCCFIDGGDDGATATTEVSAPEFPVGFVVLKEDGYTIDALGTYSQYRKIGVARSIVDHCVNLAKEREVEVYVVDSLISSILFWRGVGFDVVPAKEIPKGKLGELAYHRPMRKFL